MGLSMALITMFDRYILEILTDLLKVGIYTMAYKFLMVLNMVLVTPFRFAFSPLMFRLAEEQALVELYRKFMTYYMFAGFLFFLVISIYAKELIILFTTIEYVIG